MDRDILLFLNGITGHSAAFDEFMWHCILNHLFKGLAPMLLFWALWFRPGGNMRDRRNGLMATLFIAVCAIATGRSLALLLPFHDRPIHIGGLGLTQPLSGVIPWGGDMSSLPSDHAVLAFAIAVSLLLLSRPAGIVALIHAVLIVALPRIIMGVHWPSDVLAGALIGICVALIGWRRVTSLVSASALLERYGLAGALNARSVVGYAFVGLITYQTATMFELSRTGVGVTLAMLGR